MPNNVCLYLSLWAGRYLWLQDLGKDRGSRVGKKNFSKPTVVAVKRDKECVCVWGKVGEGGGFGERDHHWGYLNNLEMCVNYVTREYCIPFNKTKSNQELKNRPKSN